MFRHYLKSAWRQLFKEGHFTIFNLAGLSTGLACSLLIYLWAYDEFRFDHFHAQDGQLYQVMEHRPYEGTIRTSGETAPLLGEAIVRTMPEVSYAVPVTPPSWFGQMTIVAGKLPMKAPAIFAGKDYFNLFSYPLLQGHAQQVLADRQSVVISSRLAASLFPHVSNVLGKTIRWQIATEIRYATISGVFETMPAQSSVQADVVLPFEAFKALMNISGVLDNQNSFGPFFTYLLMKKGTDIPAFNKRLNAFIQEYNNGRQRQLFVRPYADNYLYSDYENGVLSGGRIKYVRLFSLIAAIILLIACINFMNLSTARATSNMKDIGIRKTIGARRHSIVWQYMTGAVLMSLLALLIATVLVVLLLPAFNHITGKQLTLSGSPHILLAFPLIALLTGLIAGSYPALYLSRFQPLSILKSKVHAATGALWLRKGLVVLQFTMSVVFIVAVLVVYQQIEYVQSQRAGYDKEHVIYFESEGKVPAHMSAFIASLKEIGGVGDAGAMVGNIIGGGPSIGIPWKTAQGETTLLFKPFLVSPTLLSTLGIPLKEGQGFSGNVAADSTKIILNETAVKVLGLTQPVGQRILWGSQYREVIGVAKDFHFESLHEAVKPVFFQADPLPSTIMVRLKAGETEQALADIRQFYQRYNPGFAFSYQFLDAAYQAQYVSGQRVAVLSRYFAGLAVLISCLGLSGLAAFSAEKRRKEIGIRKVLGATAGQLIHALSKDFLRSVIIAICLALPLAWYIMDKWLERFAYHVRVGVDTYLVAAVLMAGIALLAISIQTVRAALTNPTRSLRSE
ncbi:ABC transporter permease [Chitinophaga sp. MD30]|uniref:ABC transporter permease n=1 Tax=Chitinophaga sp. MD30 TaxID=2033437 RepID=UPI000BB0143B|nr:ABC transporter permease [Chitinophaga sp. MD30]ASZ12307.1 transporter permease [Chitinophaga sp. MD30]